MSEPETSVMDFLRRDWRERQPEIRAWGMAVLLILLAHFSIWALPEILKILVGIPLFIASMCFMVRAVYFAFNRNFRSANE